MTQETLGDLRAACEPEPDPATQDVLEAVALLLGHPESDWERLIRFVGSRAFTDGIQQLNCWQSVTREQFQRLRHRLGHPDFDEEVLKTLCVPIVPLAMWCRSIGVYLSKTRFRGGPEIRPVAAAGLPAEQAGEAREAHAEPTEPVLVVEPRLDELSPEELRCVAGLTVSRPGVGEVAFHGETDCSGVCFERDVSLRVGEVNVYPEHGSKPPPGSGLNKAATITMYRCWPPDGNNLLQDERSQEWYKRKIQAITEEKDARFIDYDCVNGVWKFSVEHF